MEEKVDDIRDHVFVSYAREDLPFVEWLVYKLTSLGYKVWCDRVKIFGGDPYPKDIDKAIKCQTHRFLAVMSKHSVNKPNPMKERTTAHNISAKEQINFIIPLNLGLEPSQLDWMNSDLTFVDFTINWAEGFTGLLKALRKAETPCPLEKGRDMVSDSIISKDIVKNEPEILYSNILIIKKIPEAISVVRLKKRLDSNERNKLYKIWACRRIGGNIFLSFHMPPEEFPFEVQNAHLWRSVNSVEGIDTHNLVSELLKKNLYCYSLTKGLLRTPDYKWLYFPFGITTRNRLPFVDTYGKKNSILACGERKFFRPGKVTRYKYYLAPTFRIMREMFGQDFIVRLGVRIRITNKLGETIIGRSAQARRKHVSKDWWNYEWISRYLAVCRFLCNEDDEIVIGTHEPYKLVFSGRTLRYNCRTSLDEKRIDEKIKERKNIVI